MEELIYTTSLHATLIASAFLLPVHHYVVVIAAVGATVSLVEYLYPSASPITQPLYTTATDEAAFIAPWFVFGKLLPLHYAVAVPPLITATACSIEYMRPKTMWMKDVCKAGMDTTAYFVGTAILEPISPSSVWVPAARTGGCVIKEVVKAKVTGEAISPWNITFKCAPLITEYGIKAYAQTNQIELLRSRTWAYVIGGFGNGVTKSLISVAQHRNETISEHLASITWLTFRIGVQSIPGAHYKPPYSREMFATETTLRIAADAGGAEFAKKCIRSAYLDAYTLAGKVLSSDTHVSNNTHNLPCLTNEFFGPHPICHIGSNTPLPNSLDHL